MKLIMPYLFFFKVSRKPENKSINPHIGVSAPLCLLWFGFGLVGGRRESIPRTRTASEVAELVNSEIRTYKDERRKRTEGIYIRETTFKVLHV